MARSVMYVTQCCVWHAVWCMARIVVLVSIVLSSRCCSLRIYEDLYNKYTYYGRYCII